MPPFARVSFPVALVGMAGFVIAGVYLYVRWASPWPLVALLGAAAVLGAAFLLDYRTRPLGEAPTGSDPGVGSADLSDEEDPVIEADRLASGEAPSRSAEDSPTGPPEHPVGP